MRKNLLGSLLGIFVLIVVTAVIFIKTNKNEESLNPQNSLTEKRQTHKNFLKNSPYKETLTWEKKKRKQKGLPPNKYFEQLWELSINPATGKLDDGKLSLLREEIRLQRQTQRSPGEATNPWVERGPNNVGGRTRVIMFDPNDSSNNTVYAGGVSGGLWKNTNISSSSSTWARVANVPGNLSVTSITVDPRNSNRWYVGTGEQYTAGDVVGNGVYMTNDGGNTWSAVNIPAAGASTFEYSSSNLFLSGIYYVNDILAWDNGSSTELFVAVGSHVYGDASDPTNWLGMQSAGLYRSTNGGSTWSRVESANMRYNTNYFYIPNDLEVSANNTLWMGTINSGFGQGGGRVYSSTNGSVWNEATASPLPDSNRVELETSSTNANKIYALTQGVSSPVHIYSTTNAFGSVSSISLPNDADTGISSSDFCRGQSFYNLVIEADPANDNVVYVGGIDLFKSTNGGSSWTQISHWYGGFGYQNVHADQHSIAFGNNSSSKMLFGNDGGIYYSGNAGGTIGKRNTGYNVTQFVKAGIGPDGAGDTSGIFTAGAQDNGTQAFRNSASGIDSSEPLTDGDGFYTFVDKDGQYLIATYVYNVIYRFDLPWNGQGRQQGAATSLSNSQSTGSFVNQMDYDSDANRLLSNNSSGTSNSILSINVAANSKGSLTNSMLTSEPTAFRASPYATNTWFVGTETGSLFKLSNVGNSSATWASINTPFVGSVSSIRFGNNANEIIVTMHNYGVTSVWYSNNGGSSWISKEGNLPNIPVRDFYLNPLNPEEAILATQLGVWKTSNFTSSTPSWSQAYNGMSDVSVTSFDYWNVSGDHTENKIIASTYGRGVFTGSFTGNTVSDTQSPSVPANLIASNITETSLQLSWTASTDNVSVSGYNVYQGTILITTVTNTNYNVTGLNANTEYTYSVDAKDEAGNVSAKSNTVSITTLGPDIIAPTAPSNLSVSNLTGTSLSLNWTASTDNVGVTAYRVYRGSTLIATVSSTNYNVSGLNAGSTYTFSIIALDAAGNTSANSNTVNVTTPSPDSVAPNAPSNLTASNITTSSANLSWTAASDNVGVTAYLVIRDGTTIATITGTTHQVSGLSAQTTYNFIVKAKDAAGNISDASNSVDVTTLEGSTSYCSSASTNVSDEYISRVQLNTINNSSNGQVYSDFTSISTQLSKGNTYTVTITPTWTGTIYSEAYNVWIDYNKDGDFTDAGENVFTQTATQNTSVSGSFVVPATAADKTTRMRVSMKYNSNATPCETFTYGEVEDYTVVIGGSSADTTAPSTPTNLMANNITQTSTDLNWSASSDNVGVVAYDVYQGSSIIATVTNTNFEVTGLNASTSYSFRVKAKDATGNTSGFSNSANVTTLSAGDTQSPSAPTNLTASNITETSTVLNWNASTDNVGVTGYNVYRSNTLIATTSSTTYQVTGLNSSTSYAFTVKAKDAAGNLSAFSNSANITTLSAGDTQSPSTPTNLTATNVTETSTILSWNASTDNIGVTGYNIYRSNTLIATASTTTFQVNGLNPSTAYAFTVKAKDATGNLSASSNQVNITTDPIAATCNDGIQNGDETGIDCGGTSCEPCQTTGPDVLNQGYFETGMDGWQDGGNDCFRSQTSASYEGNYSIRLRDNSGIESSMTLSQLDITPYNQVEIDFYFYANSMEAGEDFKLSFYNGSTWFIIATYTSGAQFSNNTFYNASVIVDASQNNFDANAGFRIQNDASGNNDQIYIDQVTVTGHYGVAPVKNAVETLGTMPFKDDFTSEEDFKVYPNPVQGNIINVLLPGSISTDYRIINMLGQTVDQGHTSKEINVSALKSGMYFIEVNDGEEVLTKRFIRN